MTDNVLDRFVAIVGNAHALRGADDIAPYLIEPRGIYHDRSPLVLRPGSVDEVSQILATATETGTAIVPQSGNTGHTGGQVPLEGESQVIVSLSRLNTIRDVDPVGNTMTVETGCILEDIHGAVGQRNCGTRIKVDPGIGSEVPDIPFPLSVGFVG
ncbi:MAG: FAD-binding oxidoreductase [Pseudomonadota bacterium]